MMRDGRRGRVATIGTFDGVHRGHQCLLGQVRRMADERGMEAVAITFATSPRCVLGRGERASLTSRAEREVRLRRAGMDDVVVLDFTPEMAQMTARDFMCRVLSERLGVEVLVIGYDHRFGRNRSEGFEDYVRYGRELGMEVVRGEVCLVGDEPVSSTRVRGALAVGDVAEAARLLGYAYRLCGKVVGGYRVGRKIGFPTANLCLDGCDKLLPADGVYAVRVNVDDDVDDNEDVDGAPSLITHHSSLITHHSPRIGMLNIGHRPTVNNGAERSFEVHIIGFEGDLYGRPLCIELVERLREERSFASLEELTAQLANDRETVMAIFDYNT